jgi:hypothetical protein
MPIHYDVLFPEFLHPLKYLAYDSRRGSAILDSMVRTA